MAFDPDLLDDLRLRIDPPDGEAVAAVRTAIGQRPAAEIRLGWLAQVASWFAGAQAERPAHQLRRPRVIALAPDTHAAAAPGAGDADAAGATAVDPDPGTALRAHAEQVGASVRLLRLPGHVAASSSPESAPASPPESAPVPPPGSVPASPPDSAADPGSAARLPDPNDPLALGARTADDEVDAGADLLILGSLAPDRVVAAAAAAITLRLEPSVVVRRAGVADAAWMREVIAVRDAMRHGRPAGNDPLELLALLGDAQLTAMVGVILGAAARRTPILLDGLTVTVAALLARELCYDGGRWLIAAHAGSEPAQAKALEWLDLQPLLDLDFATEDGSGALLTLPLIRAGIDAVRVACPPEEFPTPVEEVDEPVVTDDEEAPDLNRPEEVGSATDVPEPDADDPTETAPPGEPTPPAEIPAVPGE